MPAIMICGTASDVGKTRLVTGLCRILKRKGLAVAPFKAQNMSLNSYVTKDGCEIARSVVSQAKAAGCEPEVDMNPVLLKPTSKDLSQVILMGKPYDKRSSDDFIKKDKNSQDLLSVVKESYFRLSASFDVIILEGAGGAAEINLLQNDIVNLPLADELDIPVIMVADIERGGVFASLYGTYQILPNHLRNRLAGFIINKMHGNPLLLESGISWLEENTGMKCLGILPYINGIFIDGEDSLSYQKDLLTEHNLLTNKNAYGQGSALDEQSRNDTTLHDVIQDQGGYLKSPNAIKRKRNDLLDIVILRFPYLSNYTDFDPLFLEASVTLRFVSAWEKIGTPDLIILPGSKNTVGDFLWMKERDIDKALYVAHTEGSILLGICAGYQMLGTKVEDDFESQSGLVETLGMLPIATKFSSEKTIRYVNGESLFPSRCDIKGYEIHHGVISYSSSSPVRPLFVVRKGWQTTSDEESDLTDINANPASKDLSKQDNLYEGCYNFQHTVFGTSLHGVFESDNFRVNFLQYLANKSNKNISISTFKYEDLREYEIDKIADTCEKYLDTKSILRLIYHGK